MADRTVAFFDELGRRGHEPLLQKATGSVRFDLVDGKRTERWLLSIGKGDLAIATKNGPADCVVRADRKLFSEVVRGRKNVIAAVLRGAIQVEGDVELFVLVQRLFPGSAGASSPPPAGYAQHRR